MPPSEKAVFVSQAAIQNERARDYAGENFPDCTKRQARLLDGPKARIKKQYKAERFRAVQTTFTQILNHPIFQSASELHAFGTSVRPSIISTGIPQVEINAERQTIFGYDRQRLTNPPKMPLFQPCGQRNGGFCDKDDILNTLDALTFNIYVKTKDFKADFPIFLEFEVAHGRSWYAFLGRLIGQGKIAFLSHAVHFPVDGQPDGAAEFSMTSSIGGAGALFGVPITSQKYFQQLLCDHARREDMDPCDVQHIQMRRWNFRRDPTADHFRILLDGVHSEFPLSCHVKAKPENLAGGLPYGLTLSLKGKLGHHGSSKADKAPPKEKRLDEDFSEASDSGGDIWETDRSWGINSSDYKSADEAIPDGVEEAESGEEAAALLEEPPPPPEPKPWNNHGQKSIR